MTERDKARCDNWLAQYIFNHPLIASDVEILPGLSLRQMAIAVARESWTQAVESEREAFNRQVQAHHETQTLNRAADHVAEVVSIETGKRVEAQRVETHLVASPEHAQTYKEFREEKHDERARETREEARKRKGAGIREYWAKMTPEQRTEEIRKRFGDKRKNTNTSKREAKERMRAKREDKTDNGPISVPENASAALKQYWTDLSAEQQNRVAGRLAAGEEC